MTNESRQPVRSCEKIDGRSFSLSSFGGEGRGEEAVFLGTRFFSQLLSGGEASGSIPHLFSARSVSFNRDWFRSETIGPSRADRSHPGRKRSPRAHRRYAWPKA